MKNEGAQGIEPFAFSHICFANGVNKKRQVSDLSFAFVYYSGCGASTGQTLAQAPQSIQAAASIR